MGAEAQVVEVFVPENWPFKGNDAGAIHTRHLLGSWEA